MKNTKYLLDTTSPRTKYRVGRRFITSMGVRLTGVIVKPDDLPYEIVGNLLRRAYPNKPLIPVRFDNGEYNWMCRQFLALNVANSC